MISASAAFLILILNPTCTAKLGHAVTTGLGGFTDPKISFGLVFSSFLADHVLIKIFPNT